MSRTTGDDRSTPPQSGPLDEHRIPPARPGAEEAGGAESRRAAPRPPASPSSGRSGVHVAVEILLVFVGILAAFALESWWAGRSEHARELSYLEGMAGEFQTAEAELRELREGHQAEARRFEELHRLLRTGEGEAHPDSVLALANHLWTVSVYSPQMPVYQNLLETTGLSLIEDQELRRALTAYELVVDSNAQWDDYLVAFDRDLLVATLGPRLPFFADVFEDGDFGGELRPDIRDLAADMELRNIIAIRAFGERTLTQRRTELIEAVQDVRRLISRAVK